MSEISANIIVETNNVNVQVEESQVGVTVEPINLNIYSAGFATAGGNLGELQYNAGILAGIPNVTYTSGNLSLGNIANVKILGGTANYALFTDGNGNLSWQSVANANFASFANVANIANSLNASSTSNVYIGGGTNGYVLQTDGAGNLTWTAQTGNGGGNGTPGGANTQIQYNDSGSFGGNSGFTFNETNGNVNIPGNLIVTSNITGTIITPAQTNITSVGTLSSLNVSTTTTTANANVTTLNVSGVSNLNSVGNVKITGGSNGQVITTDGTGNLSFTDVSVTTWSNVANIGINDIFLGKTTGVSNNIVQPGNTITTNSSLNFTNFVSINANVTGNVGELGYGNDNNMWTTTFTGNTVAVSNNGTSWTSYNTPIKAKQAPLKGSNQYIIFATGTNVAAKSTTAGVSWSNVALPNSGSWSDIAYGSNTFIISSAQNSYLSVARSTDDGNTWANVLIGFTQQAVAFGPANTFMIVGTSNGAISTNGGSSWSNITVPSYAWNDVAYGNNKWCAVAANAVTVSSDDGNTWTTTTITGGNYSRVAFANPYFVITESATTGVKYSIDGNTWSNANSVANGGYIGYNPIINQIVIAAQQGPNGQANIAILEPVTIKVTSSDGNIANSQSVPNGTYKNLGGVIGNVGALWTRTA